MKVGRLRSGAHKAQQTFGASLLQMEPKMRIELTTTYQERFIDHAWNFSCGLISKDFDLGRGVRTNSHTGLTVMAVLQRTTEAEDRFVDRLEFHNQ